MRWRRRSSSTAQVADRPVVLTGPVWLGDGTEHAEGRVVVEAGVVTAVGAAGAIAVPFDATEVAGGWIGPGLVDAHVHLAFGDPAHALAQGVVAVRDLGAPAADAVRWRQLEAPRVEVAGPLLTAAGGYPSRSWGSAGFAAFIDDEDQARRLVAGLASQVDVIKLALEPAGGPVPSPAVTAAVVDAAHEAARRVSVHALSVEMVERALDAGADELAHTPTERLPAELVDRLAAAGTTVISTLATFVASGAAGAAVDNAAALAAAGVELRYGTDLGNARTRPGADLRELRLLAADVGLGADGALRAATVPLRPGQRAGVVALRGDPRRDSRAWQRPIAVVAGTTLLTSPGAG